MARRSGGRGGSSGTVRVYEVLFHDDERPHGGAAGDGSFVKRFKAQGDAEDFAKDKHYYGKSATVSPTDAPRETARRWGII